MKDDKTYILIPVHNRRELTLGGLQRLYQNGDLEHYTVVVVDDGSTDGTEAAIQAKFPTVKLLRGDGHLWWTGAICKGMEYAISQKAEYLIWLNDDCRLSPGTLEGLVQFCRQHPNAIVGAQGVKQDIPTMLAFGGKRKTWQGFRMMSIPQGEIQPCDLLSGNLVCLPRTVIDKIGYPDTHWTPHYGGDALYLVRARNAGFDLWADARYPVYDTQPTASPLYPQHWLTAEGTATQLLTLAFTPQSGLSWRLWWRLNWEAYGLWGLVMFSKKYISLGLITLGRFLPQHTREKLQTALSPENA
jgi:glycosyltransferase involved in cell wall biosynthesis